MYIKLGHVNKTNLFKTFQRNPTKYHFLFPDINIYKIMNRRINSKKYSVIIRYWKTFLKI